MTQGPLDLRDYLSVLWRRKWAIAAVTVTTTAVAVFFAVRQGPAYTSTAEVIVRAARFDPTQPSAEFGFTNMKTEEQVANSPAVAQIALNRLADRRIRPGSVSVAVPDGTETIQFTSVAPDPAAAQATAQAYADAYLTFRLQDILHDLQAARAPITDQLETMATELSKTATELRGAKTQAQTQLLTARYSGLLSRQATLQGRLDGFPTPEDLQVGSVLQRAALGVSSGATGRNTAVLGLLVGLALGVSVAILRDRLDEGVRGRDDLELHTRAPVLAFVPRLASRNGSLVALAQPTSEGAEAYKALRVRLIHAAERRGIKSVLITSSIAGEGKTSTTANLGVALAQAGKSVVLMSADLRRPRLHEYLPGKNGTGLTEVLDGKRTIREALSWTGIKDLWVLQAGPPLPDQLDRLDSASMKSLLDQLKESADFVLIDAPPILSVADATALATMADGVLLVADPRRVQASEVAHARLELELVGAEVIGVVVNNYDPRRFSPYSSRYRYSWYGPDHGSNRSPQGALPVPAGGLGNESTENGAAGGAGPNEEP